MRYVTYISHQALKGLYCVTIAYSIQYSNMLYKFVASEQQAIPCSLGVQQAILYCLGLCKYTFAQRRNRLTTHFSERIPVVKRRISTSVFRFMQLERCGEDIFDGSTREGEGTTLLGHLPLTVYTSTRRRILEELCLLTYLFCQKVALLPRQLAATETPQQACTA